MAQVVKISPELAKFYKDWAKKIENLVQGQAPYRTGNLAESIKVEFVFDPNSLGGEFVITSSAERDGFPYWKSFQYGSLDYAAKSSKGKEPIEPGTPKKKSKGKNKVAKKGIQPLYFMNLKETDFAMLEDELTAALRVFQVQLVRQTLTEGLK